MDGIASLLRTVPLVFLGMLAVFGEDRSGGATDVASRVGASAENQPMGLAAHD